MSKDYTVGIVGGMGSYATADLFKRIIDAFPAEKEWDRPRIIIDNYCTMPSRVRAILYNEKREELVCDLSESVANLLNAGANRIILACNTSHVFLDEVRKTVAQSEGKFINIIEECARDISSQGFSEASLIASEGTVQTGIYPQIFKPFGISICSPSDSEYAKIRELIEAVKQNNITKQTLDSFVRFINDFSTDAVILGCTELPIIYSQCLQNGYSFAKHIFDPLEAAIAVLQKEYSMAAEIQE